MLAILVTAWMTSIAAPPAEKWIVVRVPEWSSSTGTLQKYERTPAKSWRELGAPIRVVVGKNGLGWARGRETRAPASSDPRKREGDLRTPAGLFGLPRAISYEERAPIGTKLPHSRATATLKCVDDSRSKYYAQIVDETAVRKDWTSAEDMLRKDDVYRRVIVVDHNLREARPQEGSCIFLHIWRAPDVPTAGCIAMEPAAIEGLLPWIDQTTRLLVLPEQEWLAYRGAN